MLDSEYLLSSNKKLCTCVLILLLTFMSYKNAVAQNKKIGLILAGKSFSFWRSIENGVRDAAEKNKTSVIMFSVKEDEVDKQSQKLAIQHFLEHNIDAIIWVPVQTEVEDFKNNFKVPLIFIDRSFLSPESVPLVATNSEKSGAMAAQDLLKGFDKNSHIAIFKLSKSIKTTLLREKAFLETAQLNGYKNIKETLIGVGYNEAKLKAKIFLKQNPKTQVVFAANESATFSTLMAIKELNLAERVKVIGFDYRTDFNTYFKDGSLVGLMVQNPYEIGYQAVELLIQNKFQKVTPKFYEVDPVVVTPQNLTTDSIKKLLAQF